MKKRNFLKTTALASLASLTVASAAWAANPVLKIGFVGVTSGPAASWGISNQRSMETRAAWVNETGGVTIGGTTYDIKIVAFDDQKDPKRAIAGMEKMRKKVFIMWSAPMLTTALPLFAQSPRARASCTSRTPFPSRCTKSPHPMPYWE